MTRLIAIGMAVIVVATGAANALTAPLSVKSTLTGKTVLPHRIHWLGIPNRPESQMREVDFLVDGKLTWVEHHPPYSFAYDGNYLVTTWLSPGKHTFAVLAIAKDGSRARTSSTGLVGRAASPPADLTGTWKRTVTAAEAGTSGHPGVWTLTVDGVGWQILDPTKHGALVDVAYLSASVLEARGGIATRNHDSREGNVWCDEPFQPVRYRWAASGAVLTLTLAGPKRCDGESDVWAGDWSRG